MVTWIRYLYSLKSTTVLLILLFGFPSCEIVKKWSRNIDFIPASLFLDKARSIVFREAVSLTCKTHFWITWFPSIDLAKILSASFPVCWYYHVSHSELDQVRNTWFVNLISLSVLFTSKASAIARIPSGPILLVSRFKMVMVLFCFKTSANFLPHS